MLVRAKCVPSQARSEMQAKFLHFSSKGSVETTASLRINSEKKKKSLPVRFCISALRVFRSFVCVTALPPPFSVKRLFV